MLLAFLRTRATIRARLRSRAFIDSLAILVLFERESETFQERFRLFVCIRRCYNRNVHAVEVLHFIQVDLREDHLLLDAKSEIASAIKALGVYPLEIAGSWQGNSNQTIEKFIHFSSTQCDARANGHAFSQLKVGDVFGRNRLHRLLTRNACHFVGSIFNDFLIRNGLSQALGSNKSW